MLNAVKQALFFPNKNISRLVHKNVFEKPPTSYHVVFYEVKDVVLPALDNNAPV